MPSCHAVILNYKRPENIGRIVRLCLNCPDITAVHVIDQANPAEQLRSLPSAKRVYYSRLPNIGAGRRVSYAAALPCDLVIGIDDDVFLAPAQITELLKRAGKFPARAHGVWGQMITEADAQFRMVGGIRNINQQVDILNRIFVFSPGQAERALGLAKRLGLDWNQLGPIDDILLSFAPPKRPLCHDVGHIEDCPTSNAIGKAVWRQPGFEGARLELLARLNALRKTGVLPIGSQ